MEKKPNRLVHESSPYLLQHAHNPVDWYPWGEEALNRARAENKPILISIGYSACHWCHVMEKESFEDETTAQFMNEHFINIKIDREERPDLDHIYMDAVQAMTGSGGWPLNVFLTPEGKPFYGGTYFPPVRAYNRPSWRELLQTIATNYRQRKTEIDAQAEGLVDHLIQSNSFGINTSPGNEIFSRENLDEIFETIMKSADKKWGGFGHAPKFPQSFVILYLLRYYHVTKNDVSLKQAILSLDKMIEGGIYDQLGGGFARYSTDAEWLAPHFEKMLYDNALMVAVLSEAYQLTKKERYRDVIDETLGFILREMMHPAGGFYSAFDADSEGEEGKFYVWKQDEVNELLGEDAGIFSEYFDISPTGNWEGKNILHIKQPAASLAANKNLALPALRNLLDKGKKLLLEQRNKRIRPGLDDKIILGWNALMNTACSKAFAATGNESYRELAVNNMNFLLKNFRKDGTNEFCHTWKNGKSTQSAFLDDYAYLIEALIHLQEITGNTEWLHLSKSLLEKVMERFSDESSVFFYFTGIEQKDVILRKKEIYDGAVPSGNSVMAFNLNYLSVIFDKKNWRERSLAILSSLGRVIVKYPSSFGNFACLLLEAVDGSHEIVITGSDHESLHTEVLHEYIPHRILMATGKADSSFPLLAGKEVNKQALVYVCKNYTCLSPVNSVNALRALINNPNRA
jgi:uncharacterized protein YyaL (SSP411 family)